MKFMFGHAIFMSSAADELMDYQGLVTPQRLTVLMDKNFNGISIS